MSKVQGPVCGPAHQAHPSGSCTWPGRRPLPCEPLLRLRGERWRRRRRRVRGQSLWPADHPRALASCGSICSAQRGRAAQSDRKVAANCSVALAGTVRPCPAFPVPHQQLRTLPSAAAVPVRSAGAWASACKAPARLKGLPMACSGDRRQQGQFGQLQSAHVTFWARARRAVDSDVARTVPIAHDIASLSQHVSLIPHQRSLQQGGVAARRSGRPRAA